MDYAGWNRIGLIAERHNDQIWMLSRDAIIHVLQLDNATVAIVSTFKDEPLSISLDQELEIVLRNTANVSRSKCQIRLTGYIHFDFSPVSRCDISPYIWMIIDITVS